MIPYGESKNTQMFVVAIAMELLALRQSGNDTPEAVEELQKRVEQYLDTPEDYIEEVFGGLLGVNTPISIRRRTWGSPYTRMSGCW